jgi:hypothetical protein
MEQNQSIHEDKWKKLPTEYIGLRLTAGEVESLKKLLESTRDLPKALDNVLFKLNQIVEHDGIAGK